MDMFEEAQALCGMIQMLGLTQDEVAKRLGVSQSYIANKIRLLRFSPTVREQIRCSGISERHARALLRLQNDTDILFLVNKIKEEGLTVQTTEELVDAQIALCDGAGITGAVTLIERVMYSYTDAIHQKGVRIKKVVEESEGAVTLSYTVARI